jgi:hypothetical protein
MDNFTVDILGVTLCSHEKHFQVERWERGNALALWPESLEEHLPTGIAWVLRLRAIKLSVMG